MQILEAHVSLNVSKIDNSVAFYEKAFGVATTALACCGPNQVKTGS